MRFVSTATLPKGPSSDYFHKGNANSLGSFFHAGTERAVGISYTFDYRHTSETDTGSITGLPCKASPAPCWRPDATVCTARNCIVCCLHNPQATLN